MGAFDQAGRYAIKTEPAFVLGRLRRELELTLAHRDWLPTRLMPLPGGPDRDADLVQIADGPDDPAWLLIYELQSEHDPEKIRVLNIEAAVLLEHARDTDRGGALFRPLPVFVYLAGRCPEPELVIETPSGHGLSLRPVVWEIEGDAARDTLAEVESGAATWGALFWVSLMAGAGEDEVIEWWRRLRDERVPAESQADVTQIALVLSERVGRRKDWERTREGVAMTESTVVNEIMEEAALEESRDMLREAIRFRFPEILTPDVERAIADQPSLGLMRAWRRAIFTVRDGDEFLAILRQEGQVTR